MKLQYLRCPKCSILYLAHNRTFTTGFKVGDRCGDLSYAKGRRDAKPCNGTLIAARMKQDASQPA